MKSENVQQPHRVIVEDVVGPYVSLYPNGAFRPFVCPVGIMGWAFHPLAMSQCEFPIEFIGPQLPANTPWNVH